MDIKATSAEALTKATAWLTTNLVADEAPAVQPQVVTPPAGAPPAEVKPSDPVAPVASKPGLADVIRRDREARAAAAAASSEAGKYKGELEALRKENEALKGTTNITDPLEFIRTRGLTKEQQALWGQAFLYDLKPEVAPQEFRLELYKAEQAKKEQDRMEQAQREKAEQAQAAKAAEFESYSAALLQHVQSSPGSNPESELWFTEETDAGVQVNHRVYAQSLLATANNLAQRAQASGQIADLRPANVAKVLEEEVSKRMKRRDAKLAGSANQTKQTGQSAQGGTQAAAGATSAEGLRSGAPRAPAQTDEERRARAAAVLFGTK